MTKTLCDNCGREFHDSMNADEVLQNEHFKFKVYCWAKNEVFKTADFCPSCVLKMLQELPPSGDTDWPDRVGGGDDKKPFIFKS